MRLNPDQAGRLLSRMLVGGGLREMRVNGPAMTLVFQNDKLAHGFLADVDFAFSCRAAVCLAPCEGTFPKEEFHTSRSLFLAEMYKLNGMAIDSVELPVDGCVCVTIGAKVVQLRLVEADDAWVDDWIWQVTAEKAVSIPDFDHLMQSVSCVAEGSSVNFFGS